MIFFDACLMGMVESAHQVQPYADYLIAKRISLVAVAPIDLYFDPGSLHSTIDTRDLVSGIVAKYNLAAPSTSPLRSPQ